MTHYKNQTHFVIVLHTHWDGCFKKKEDEKQCYKISVITRVCNPSTWKGGGQELRTSLEYKVKPSMNNKATVHMPVHKNTHTQSRACIHTYTCACSHTQAHTHTYTLFMRIWKTWGMAMENGSAGSGSGEDCLACARLLPRRRQGLKNCEQCRKPCADPRIVKDTQEKQEPSKELCARQTQKSNSEMGFRENLENNPQDFKFIH